MEDIRGHAKRLFQPPGYHIKSEYDLQYLRDKRSKGSGRDFNVVLPLTSLIDMFSMLVIFLIMNFSATGEVFFIARDVKLPEAINAEPLESLPLITVTSKQVLLDTEKVGSAMAPLKIKDEDFRLKKLRLALRKLKSIEERLNPNKKFKGRINIQADRGIASIYIKRVMTVLIGEGWLDINFAVRKTE